MDIKINLKDLKIDPSYQRAPDERRIRKIASNWDDLKANLVHVSHRPDGYYVIDGNHTRLACERAGHTDILCRVHEGLTINDEAQLFVELNMNNKKPTFAELLKARAEAGCELEKTYLDLLDDTNIKYSLKSAGTHGCELKCHSNMLAVYKTTDFKTMKKALWTAKEAANGREEFYKTGYFPGMCMFVICHPEADTDRLITCIRKTPSSKIMEIADKYNRGTTNGGKGVTRHYYMAFVEIYNKGLKINKIIAK